MGIGSYGFQLKKLVNNASCLNPSLTETGVTAMKVYKPEEGSTSVHAMLAEYQGAPLDFQQEATGNEVDLDTSLMNLDEYQVQDTNDSNDLAEDLSTPDDLNRDNQDRSQPHSTMQDNIDAKEQQAKLALDLPVCVTHNVIQTSGRLKTKMYIESTRPSNYGNLAPV